VTVSIRAGDRLHVFKGRWIEGSPWQRFGLYNCYVVVRSDGRLLKMPAHAGELVPGSTEDLVAALRACGGGTPQVPMTIEVDPTYRCASRDCGGFCFSAKYRSLAPGASIATNTLKQVIDRFASDGGRVVRFDGGGDPLLHPDVRSGYLVEFAAARGLKTTVLTSGDTLDRANLDRLAASGCYVRVSLNAASDTTRRRFHGNAIALARITRALERLAASSDRMRAGTPIGATYLLAPDNYAEVVDCARLARRVGISHFSVRRILGPSWLRPDLAADEMRISGLLEQVRQLHSDDFRVAVPWRSLGEPDLSPANRDIQATLCWQSTFKAVIEPDIQPGRVRWQLCGRYRGGGIGQRLAMPALFSLQEGTTWTEKWRESFSAYQVSRQRLLDVCVSCIDRGFILMVDRLFQFVRDAPSDFRVLHLDSPEPGEVREY
jgi:hypothetical protein